MEAPVEDVRLPDLETIRRFSIAVRSEHAPAEQVLEALEMDLQKIQQAMGRRTPRTASPRTRSTRSTRKA
jgi:hypothetical protein